MKKITPDLKAGDKFNRWTVIERDHKHKSRDRYYLCECDCGTKKSVRISHLTKRESTGCSNCRKTNLKKMEKGEKFGRLTVISMDTTPRHSPNIHWKCKCECGKLVTVRGTTLMQGRQVSCGCYIRELINAIRKAKRKHKNIAHLEVSEYRRAVKKEETRMLTDSYIIGRLTKRSILTAQDIPIKLIKLTREYLKVDRLIKDRMPSMIGQRYGKWVVISESAYRSRSSRGRHWLCKCDCGVKKPVRNDLLSSGRSKSCGCSKINRLIKERCLA